MKTIIAGNFKANLTRREVQDYAQRLDKELEFLRIDSAGALQVDIFPSHTALLDDTF